MIAKAKDDSTLAVESHLRDAFPNASVDAYRYNPAAIRVRIVDEGFAGLSRVQRYDAVVRYIDQLPEELALDVTLVIPLTSEELTDSPANFEFEHPSPSGVE